MGFTFAIKGRQGDAGEQGIQGIQGIQGDKGDKGDTGESGFNPWVDRGEVTSFDAGVMDFEKDGEKHCFDLSGIVGIGERLVLIQITTVATEMNKLMRVSTTGYDSVVNSEGIYTAGANVKNERSIWIKTDANGSICYEIDVATWIVINAVVRGWFVL